ncbi:DUF488 family protein SAV0238 [hydrothermal vent metagenome]|uniref:DUF488 family protein SAV0238 n=1 Tax=hydrothermal vent metagenome TaxID=652676 RepID=A0A3B0V2J8_9ZZZZ
MDDERFIITVKRIYDEPTANDGFRVLVDRLWPRGVSKEAAQLDLWLGDIAPSPSLRKWFKHDPACWEQFVDRYFMELDERPEIITDLFQQATSRHITLLYAAKEPHHNHANALKQYLQGA